MTSDEKTDSSASARGRLRSWLLTAAIVLLAFEVLYVVAANVMGSTTRKDGATVTDVRVAFDRFS
jgi:hypothetical protein